MTIDGFEGMSMDGKIKHLQGNAILIHSLIRGNLIISLFWSKDLIFEVFKTKNNGKIYDIKTYNRFEYAA